MGSVIDTTFKITQAVLLPAAIAWGGWIVQDGLKEDQLAVERLKLAVSILSSKTDADLREYGVALLIQSSPEGAVGESLEAKLRKNDVSFPPQSNASLSNAYSISPSVLAAQTYVGLLLCMPEKENKEYWAWVRTDLTSLLLQNGFTPRGPSHWSSLPDQSYLGGNTVMVDMAHPERGDVERLQKVLASAKIAAPRIVENPGTPSPWYLGLVLCPE